MQDRAGAALLREPERAVAVARAAIEGSGLPVTVKLRSGIEPGDRSGFDLALRLVAEAGVAAIGLHPRSAAAAHRGRPDYALVRELVEALDARRAGPGDRLRRAAHAPSRRAAPTSESGADAVMIARGALGNPWIFEELTGRAVTGRRRRRRSWPSSAG